jgi:hypothetical protein
MATINAAIMNVQAIGSSHDPIGSSTNNPVATAWSSVFSLPPRLAGMMPYRMTQKRSADECLVGDRVGQLAEFGDQPALARDVAVDAVGDGRDGEHHPGEYPPRGVVTATGEQRHDEDRHQGEPEDGQRVRDVPRGRRAGRVAYRVIGEPRQ